MEWLLFLKRFLQAPIQVGSVLPSSRHLAAVMVNSVPWDRCHVIIELGAGTGVITRVIEQRRRKDSLFYIFECDPLFRSLLQNLVPSAHILEDAMHMRVVKRYANSPADAILSGLPLAAMSRTEQEQILTSVCQVLAPDGVFVAFQYTPLLWPVLRHRFQHVEVRFCAWNVPPAFVYVCTGPRPQLRAHF